jgi:hypothetical protein
MHCKSIAPIPDRSLVDRVGERVDRGSVAPPRFGPGDTGAYHQNFREPIEVVA